VANCPDPPDFCNNIGPNRLFAALQRFRLFLKALET